MNLQVEIERHSGFCGGVIRAIGRAEKFLEEHPGRRLYSLGDIVHNEAELNRLCKKGLVTIGKESLMNIPASGTVLIRAHGEPPQTYSLAARLGLTVIDCTCPVVLKLQKSIREAYERVKPVGGQIIIFGKIGHAEVLGLLGQVGGDAVVIENMPMLLSALEDGSIQADKPLEIFSQTTKSPEEYSEIRRVLSESFRQARRPMDNARDGLACATSSQSRLTVHNTICSQVASRHKELAEFSLRQDTIIFVSGLSSSNGKVLFDLCKSCNPRTYHISDPSGLVKGWFRDGDRVGVCGATSTPRWLLEQVAEAISGL